MWWNERLEQLRKRPVHQEEVQIPLELPLEPPHHGRDDAHEEDEPEPSRVIIIDL